MHPRILILTFVLVCNLAWIRAHADDLPQLIQTPGIKISLITNQGKKTNFVPMQTRHLNHTVVFKYAIAKPLRDYKSWGLEITEPNRKLNFRMAVDGEIPPLIHWDGKFKNAVIVPDEKYFVRLFLQMPRGRVFVSEWTSFRTQLASDQFVRQVPSNELELSFIPWGTFNYAFLKSTAETRSMVAVEFEPQVLIGRSHSIGIFAAVSTNILADALELANAATSYYSQISLFYRYELWGNPIRRPNLPFIPPYLTESERPKIKIRRYSKRPNLQVGIRLNSMILRSFDGTPANDALAGQWRGPLATLNFDYQLLGPFRLRTAAEAGYSLFQGSALMATAQAGFTYEGIVDFSPGIGMKYLFVKGNRSGTSHSITNHLLSVQLMVQGKI